ncbi:hypothetical protein, partial [Massilia sp. DWR3-1-1]|uniref:hypothetical protein n=1 Tax=Massilia sp. DWR3-1-1 TaxID=2804559 RepID=UPI003CEE4AD0
LLAPPWHHQIEASGPTSEIAQVHEPEAVLRRGAAKFGGLGEGVIMHLQADLRKTNILWRIFFGKYWLIHH